MADDEQRREVRSDSQTVLRPRQPRADVPPQQPPGRARAQMGDVSFPIAVRGYERHAVDEYVARVDRVIAELESPSPPPAAVRHTLDRVGEQIGGVLQHARQAAEEITAEAAAEAEATAANARTEAARATQDAELQAQQLRGRAKQQADDTLVQAKQQAAELIVRAEEQARAVREQAEPRLRELEADTQAVWETRRKLLEDLPRMATELMEIAGAASARLRRTPGAGPSPGQSAQLRQEGSPVDAGAAAEPVAGGPLSPSAADRT